MKQIAFFGLISSALLALSLMLAPSSALIDQTPAPSHDTILQNPEELGAVHWLRDLQAGQAQAEKTGKPLLILFQEVPGCSNCTRYGNTTLSHPLIVEAIESYFVPVCIYNNKGGKDGEALRQFAEPAWNNPVVRIVGADGKDIVERMPNFNSPFQLINGMNRALRASQLALPDYLKLLEAEYAAREAGLETATFSMHCFWSGEGAFGSIEGVIETEPGFQDGREVVRVQFDPKVINKAALEAITKPKGVNACAKNEGFRIDQEPKYYLSHSDYRFLPMTSVQACRANSLIGKSQLPDEVFSPRQLALLKKITENPGKSWKNMIGRKDLAKGWAELASI